MKFFFITSAIFFLTVPAFGQAREVIKCRIWKAKSFCMLPNAVNVPENVKYLVGSSVSSILCSELDKQNLVGIWITIREKNASELRLKNNFSNIRLIRKNTEEVLHPVAYMSRSKPAGKEEGNPQYLSNQSTFGGECLYELKLKGRYDLFILFEAADVGDTLIIEDFLEVEVR